MFLLTLCAGGCVGTKAGAYRVFSDDLRYYVGRPYKEAQLAYAGYLHEQTEVATKNLENGNVARIHNLKWQGKQREPCTILTELDINNIIVSAKAEGPGCWRPY